MAFISMIMVALAIKVAPRLISVLKVELFKMLGNIK
jgi:hypothetical protein